MYEIGICDDGKNVCGSMEKMLIQCARENAIQINVQIWNTGEELRDYLKTGSHLDILFLDIELYQMTGIEVGSYIRNELDNMGLQIVYISGKTSYAQDLFKTQPLDFLVKPITPKQINRTMETAIKVIKRRCEKFEFQQGKEHFYIKQGEILYFESSGRKISIVTVHDTYEFYGKLNEIIKELSEDFIEIHKSYVVNMAHVLRYTYEMVELENGTRLAISQNKRSQVRKRILRDG